MACAKISWRSAQREYATTRWASSIASGGHDDCHADSATGCGTYRRASPCCSPICGATREIAESLPAARVVPLLDEFFRTLVTATETHGGTIFHMAGDGMMAGFGMNDATATAHAKRWPPAMQCCRTSHLLRHAGAASCRSMRESASDCIWEKSPSECWARPAIRRPRWSAIRVNVAARLCGRARAGEVLFSCTVAAALESNAADPGRRRGASRFCSYPQFELRGRRGPIDIMVCSRPGARPPCKGLSKLLNFRFF